MTDRNYIYTFIAIPFVLCSVYFFTMQLGMNSKSFFYQEGGFIEVLTVVGYFICLFMMLVCGGFTSLKKYHYFYLFVGLLAFRELDFDKRFTTMGIFKSRFFPSPDVSFGEKVYGAIISLLLVYVLVRILRQYTRPFLAQFFTFSVYTIGVSVLGALFVVSKSLDGLARKIEPFGIYIESSLSLKISAMEEVLELGLPVVLLLLFVYSFSSFTHRNVDNLQCRFFCDAKGQR